MGVGIRTVFISGVCGNLVVGYDKGGYGYTKSVGYCNGWVGKQRCVVLLRANMYIPDAYRTISKTVRRRKRNEILHEK